MYGSARPTVLTRLGTIHHSALRICCGAFRTSPVESLYVICNQLPLHFRRQKISALYFFRSQSLPKDPISQLTLPVSLRRLYAARPSHILPFCERDKMLLYDSDFSNISIQYSDSFCFPPWDIPQFSFCITFRDLTNPQLLRSLSNSFFTTITISILPSYQFLQTARNQMGMLAVVLAFHLIL
ncbi:hypothetical protein AVEN_39032-1 [Araneus ventricosus]|uniref:Uncharacterized protein n=1 Tax=Araneus ventricosus TaxID=182803 RepID=A0A4Y2MBF2_ARAVE|nr:hypothetical protein AVEN_39032-1 [Araneus ventricosus]